MANRDALIAWFEEYGLGSNVDVADLVDKTEGFVRTEGRRRGIKRVGATMAWTLGDALDLFDDLAEEGEILDDEEDDDDDDDLDDDDLDDDDEVDLDDEADDLDDDE